MTIQVGWAARDHGRGIIEGGSGEAAILAHAGTRLIRGWISVSLEVNTSRMKDSHVKSVMMKDLPSVPRGKLSAVLA